MNEKTEAVINVVNAGTSVLLGAEPMFGKDGYSVIADWRIKGLADAIMRLRDSLYPTQSDI